MNIIHLFGWLRYPGSVLGLLAALAAGVFGLAAQLAPVTPADPLAQLLRADDKPFDAPLRGHLVRLHTYLPETVKPATPLVLFTSGAGGWHEFDGYIGRFLAGRGYPVCGLNSHSYLREFYSQANPATQIQVAADYAELIAQAKKLAGVEASRPVILAGWSLGAGYSIMAASDPQLRAQLSGVLAISLTDDNEAAYSYGYVLLSKLTGRTRGKKFRASTFLPQTVPLPVAVVQAKNDDHATPAEAQRILNFANMKNDPRLRVITINSARNHSFAGGRDEFKEKVLELLAWIVKKDEG